MKTRRSACVAILSAMVILITGMPHLNADATTTLDRLNQAQLDKLQTEQEKAESEKKRNEVQEQLNSLAMQQGTLQQQLDLLNQALALSSEHLEELEIEILVKNAEIEQTQLELEEAKNVELQQYESMKKRIQFMYERQDYAYIELMVSAQSFSEMLNAAEYIEMIADYDDKKLEEYRLAKEEVIAKEQLLESEMAQLNDLKQQNLEEQQRISELVQATAANVAKYAEQINGVQGELSSIEGEIEKKEAEIKQQEADIAALRKQYESELALSKLAAQSAKRDISEVTFEEGDRYLLANLIYCEAGGEPYAGQLAVGAVVINRVLSSVYPDTVTGVIYQNKQFSPVLSGRLALALAENRATAACYQAADEAMAGNTNVGNCVYFRTPIEGLSGISIGGHIFY